jgi:hypothetical protein
MGIYDPTNELGRVVSRRRVPVGPEATVWAPSTDTYLTNEIALFRVADALSSRGELLLELEDCQTLELILCPARTLAGRGLRTVIPALSA